MRNELHKGAMRALPACEIARGPIEARVTVSGGGAASAAATPDPRRRFKHGDCRPQSEHAVILSGNRSDQSRSAWQNEGPRPGEHARSRPPPRPAAYG